MKNGKWVTCIRAFDVWRENYKHANCLVGRFCENFMLQTIGVLQYAVYCEPMNLIKFCTCGTRWLTTHFLSMALWVIFDQEGTLWLLHTDYNMDHYMTGNPKQGILITFTAQWLVLVTHIQRMLVWSPFVSTTIRMRMFATISMRMFANMWLKNERHLYICILRLIQCYQPPPSSFSSKVQYKVCKLLNNPAAFILMSEEKSLRNCFVNKCRQINVWILCECWNMLTFPSSCFQLNSLPESCVVHVKWSLQLSVSPFPPSIHSKLYLCEKKTTYSMSVRWRREIVCTVDWNILDTLWKFHSDND